MTKQKSTKKTLLTSVLSLVLCMAMLIGTTFAWFTDSVTSGNNKIVAGNLKVDLQVLEQDNTTWTSIKDEPQPIFNYEYWEPGYTEVKILKVVNEGTLALKWKAMLTSENVLSDLANVIDVYVKEDVKTYSQDRAVLDGWTKVGTLSNFVGTLETTTVGQLNKEQSEILGIAFKMQESAGNEYQGMDLGGSFDICITATQLTAEEDSFDDQYDKDAKWAGEVATAAELQAALNRGENVKLIADIESDTPIVVPAGVNVVLNLNGYTLKGTHHKNVGAVLKNEGNLTVIEGTITSSAANGGAAIANNGSLTVNDAVLNGASNEGGSWPAYTVNNTGTMVVNNATITSVHGAVASYGTNAVVTLNDTTIDMAGIPGFTSHGIYTYDNGKAIVNGGNITNNATDQNATGGSVVNGAVTINSGIFSGRIESYYGTPVIKGGTFNTKPNSKYVATGYEAIKISDTEYLVADVNGKELVGSVNGLYADNAGEYYVYTGEALATFNQEWKTYANKNTVINLGADVDFAGYTWTPVDSHADTKWIIKEINGNGHTISNLTIEGQAMFTRFAGTGDVVIKDITFDNATVNSTAINSAILTVQSYQNVLLDNVDVKNSTITGGYKVAPLIATVYNESSKTVTATLKNCDVTNCVVKATSYDFCTTGLVAFVNAGDNDKVEFENCTVTDVTLIAPNDSYKAHAFVYTTGSGSLYNEAEGVTVTNCKFEVLK